MTSGDHAAWVAAYATIGAALLTGLSAAGVFWGAMIARRAASTWRGVHEHAKADECIAAAFDLAHAISQVIDERRRIGAGSHNPMNPAPFPGEAYDAAWVAWRRLQLAHVVARRYHANRMDRDAPDRLARTLEGIKVWSASIPLNLVGQGIPFNQAAADAAETTANDIKARTWREAEAIEAALAPPPDWREHMTVYAGRSDGRAWWLPEP